MKTEEVMMIKCKFVVVALPTGIWCVLVILFLMFLDGAKRLSTPRTRRK